MLPVPKHECQAHGTKYGKSGMECIEVIDGGVVEYVTSTDLVAITAPIFKLSWHFVRIICIWPAYATSLGKKRIKRQQKKTTAEHKQKDFVSLYFPHFVRCPYIAIPYCRNIYVRVCIYQTLDRLRTTCQYIYCKYLYISISSHRVPSDNQHFVQEATGGHTTSVSVIKSSVSSSRSIRSFRNRILILLWVSNNL